MTHGYQTGDAVRLHALVKVEPQLQLELEDPKLSCIAGLVRCVETNCRWFKNAECTWRPPTKGRVNLSGLTRRRKR